MAEQDLNNIFDQMATGQQTRKDAQSRVDALTPNELVTAVFGSEQAPVVVRQVISQDDTVLPEPRRQAYDLVSAQTDRIDTLEHRLAVNRLLDLIQNARG